MPIANLHLKDLYETTVDFFNSLSPSSILVEEAAESRDRLYKRDSGDSAGSMSSSGSAELRWRLENAEKSATSVRKELDTTSKDVAQLRSELQLLRERHRSLETTLHDTQQLLSQRDTQLQDLRDENRNLESNYQDMRRIAEERSLEVKSLEKFLTRTDRWAGAQVVQTVKDLNSEILQFSAAASETFVMDSRQDIESPERTQAIERVRARLGPTMSHCLSTRDHSQDPTLLQIALQACASQCICHALSSFCVGFPSRFDSLLSKIYIHMHSTEPQATAARWRALTHSHIRELTPSIDDQATRDIIDANLRGAATVLAASGYGEVECLVESLRTRFSAQLRHIAETAYRIAMVVREGTMSTDFQVTFVDHSRNFNHETMENVYAGYGPPRGVILCTTDLGLRCFTHRGKDGGGDGDGVIEKLVVLKPKVVLESVIQELEPE